MKRNRWIALGCVAVLVAGCSGTAKKEPAAAPKPAPAPVYFQVDPATAGTVSGEIHFKGKRPTPKAIDMSEEPACVEAHKGRAYDESLVVGKTGGLANVFVYIKS